MNASFCKVRTTVPHSIWHLRSKNRSAIFQCNEYHLDSLTLAQQIMLRTIRESVDSLCRDGTDEYMQQENKKCKKV